MDGYKFLSRTPGNAPIAQTQKVGAIIVAAGDSRRMGGLDKIFLPLLGRPLIAYSLQVINECPLIESVVLVMSRSNLDQGRRLADDYGWDKVKEVCAGGDSRQESVRVGLDRLQDTDWTLVHDGARPCVDQDMISRGLMEAQESGAAVAAVPARDTIKSAGHDRLVIHTLARDGLWMVQTPQVFSTETLSQAHRDASETASEDATDDAALVERMGRPVKIFMGSYANIKVTTPDDMPIAEAILKARAESRPGGSK